MRKSFLSLLFLVLPSGLWAAGSQINVCSTPSITPSAATVCDGTQQFTASPTGNTPFPPGAPTWTVDPSSAGSVNPNTGTITTFTASSTFSGTATVKATCDTSTSSAAVGVVEFSVFAGCQTSGGNHDIATVSVFGTSCPSGGILHFIVTPDVGSGVSPSSRTDNIQASSCNYLDQNFPFTCLATCIGVFFTADGRYAVDPGTGVVVCEDSSRTTGCN
jgi:hypothetical protein